MKKIAIDAMGGDYAPQSIVEGVNQALNDFSDVEVSIYRQLNGFVLFIRMKKSTRTMSQPKQFARRKMPAWC